VGIKGLFVFVLIEEARGYHPFAIPVVECVK